MLSIQNNRHLLIWSMLLLLAFQGGLNIAFPENSVANNLGISAFSTVTLLGYALFRRRKLRGQAH